MVETFNVLVLGGDHIGPEITAVAVKVLELGAKKAGIKVAMDEDLLGGASWNIHGTFCTDAVVEKARRADAILVGSVGGPEWDSLVIDCPAADRDGLLKLRVALDLYANLRPARAWAPILHRTPFRREVIEGADTLVVRENTGGSYFGEPRGSEVLPDGQRRAFETGVYTTSECERIARSAFEAARTRRNHVSNLDKSNAMESGKLWRETITRIGRDEYPDVELEHLYMDYAMYAVCKSPQAFDVMVTENLFGDLVSDLVGNYAGSLGMLPSASVGAPGVPGLFEPSHGSAPDISGKGIANPIGAILSVGMMFQHAFNRPDVARSIEHAVERTLEAGVHTPDIGGTACTEDVSRGVLEALAVS